MINKVVLFVFRKAFDKLFVFLPVNLLDLLLMSSFLRLPRCHIPRLGGFMKFEFLNNPSSPITLNYICFITSSLDN